MVYPTRRRRPTDASKIHNVTEMLPTVGSSSVVAVETSAL
jgi:hypothetical protein